MLHLFHIKTIPFISEIQKSRKAIQNSETSNLEDEYSSSPDLPETYNEEELSANIEEFKMHIKELLKLRAIRESRSPHRSAAFIVRNHAEEVRGKSRMVINYKRLNDNTIDDAYNVPNKQEQINRIQGSKYFF